MVKNKNYKMIAKLFHETLLCRLGAIETIVTDGIGSFCLRGAESSVASKDDVSSRRMCLHVDYTASTI